MNARTLLAGALIAVTSLGLAIPALNAAPVGSLPQITRDGSMTLAGRSVRCGNVRNVLDRNLPSEGAAAPGVLIINPRLINRMPQIVRLFVFHHECGHHNIGQSELAADCWAVEQGVQQGWLDQKGLRQVCRSFGNMPETETHPSAKRRCGNLNRCFAQAASRQQARPAAKDAEAKAAAARTPQVPSPTLISGPTLVGQGSSATGGNLEGTHANTPANVPAR